MGDQLPGPVCRVLKSSGFDTGTMCRSNSPVPGSAGKKPSPSPAEIEVKKTEYLTYARGVSYVMQTKSVGESTQNWIEQQYRDLTGGPKAKPPRIQSVLGGAYLRMYLDAKVDENIVAEAGEEIGVSPEFAKLSQELNKYMQGTVEQLHLTKPAPDRLLTIADRHLKEVKKRAPGIAFRNTLNAVIGGITDVSVDSVEHTGDVDSKEGMSSKYIFGIRFYDTYDFANQRSGEYDRYRKQLARYLIANDFEKFEDAYSREAHHPFDKKLHKTKLDNAAVFASFMYALEQKRWTAGPLPWSVLVPTEITLVFRTPPAGKSAHKAHSH